MWWALKLKVLSIFSFATCWRFPIVWTFANTLMCNIWVFLRFHFERFDCQRCHFPLLSESQNAFASFQAKYFELAERILNTAVKVKSPPPSNARIERCYHDFHLFRPSPEFEPHTELIRIDSVWSTGVFAPTIHSGACNDLRAAKSNLPSSVAQRSYRFRDAISRFHIGNWHSDVIIWSRADDIGRSVVCLVTHMLRSSSTQSLRPLFEN